MGFEMLRKLSWGVKIVAVQTAYGASRHGVDGFVLVLNFGVALSNHIK